MLHISKINFVGRSDSFANIKNVKLVATSLLHIFKISFVGQISFIELISLKNMAETLLLENVKNIYEIMKIV